MVNSPSTHRQIESTKKHKTNLTILAWISSTNTECCIFSRGQQQQNIYIHQQSFLCVRFTCPVYTIANLGVILINEIVIQKRSECGRSRAKYTFVKMFQKRIFLTHPDSRWCVWLLLLCRLIVFCWSLKNRACLHIQGHLINRIMWRFVLGVIKQKCL